MAKEVVPGVLGVIFEFTLVVSDEQDAELIFAKDAAHEIEKRGFAHAFLDQADYFAAAIVGGGGEVGEMLVLGHVLDARVRFAARPGPDHAEIAHVFALNVGEPAQAARIFEERVILGAGPIGEAMAEVGRQAFIHPGFRVAIGANDVVPPLMSELVLQEVGRIGLGDMGHVEHAVIDHHEGAALVARPAEATFHDGELLVRITSEPFVIDRQRLLGRFEECLGVKGMLRRRQAADLDAIRFADPFFEASAGDQGEIAHADRLEFEFLPAVVEYGLLLDHTRSRELLIAGQTDLDGVMPRLVVERLMPGYERRRLPAFVVQHRDDRQPLRQRRDPFPLAPASLLLG